MSLYRRPGSKYLWSKLYAGGHVHRFSTGATTKVEALRKEREEAHRLARLYKAEAVKSMATVAAQFLENVEADNLAPATRAKMEEHLTRQILPFFGEDREVSTIVVKELEDFKAKRGREVSPQTVGKELSTLRQMLDFAGEKLRLFPLGEIPTTRSPRLPRYEPKWRLLTEDELARLLIELQKQDRKGKEALPFFLLLMGTGMRSGEAAALRWDWVDFDRNEIHLPAQITKTRRARDVPIGDAARAALETVKRSPAVGRVFRYRTHYIAWHRAVHAAGLARINRDEPAKTSGVRPHDLRHTFGSLLHASGNSMPTVRDILGHATLVMANLYAHTFRGELHAAVKSVAIPVPVTVPLLDQNVPEKVTKGTDGEPRNKIASATRKR